MEINNFVLPLLYLVGVTCQDEDQNMSYERSLVYDEPGFGTEYVYIPSDVDGKEEYIKGYIKGGDDPRIFGIPNVDEVTFFTLYTRFDLNGSQITNQSKNFHDTAFDKTKPVKIITHGWMASGTGQMCTTIKDAYLKKYDANVFVFDWYKVSGNVFYPMPMFATREVGAYYGEFLNFLVHTVGVDPKQIHIVGHSLGAHVSGFAARQLKGDKVGRITGLDPALPGFDSTHHENHLNKYDAHFVDIIHSCGHFLGLFEAIGHADFYPNGGTPPQPGCGGLIKLFEACSHGKSWRYFEESINREKPWMAVECSSFDSFKEKSDASCNFDDAVAMGEPAPSTARGTYYLTTQ